MPKEISISAISVKCSNCRPTDSMVITPEKEGPSTTPARIKPVTDGRRSNWAALAATSPTERRIAMPRVTSFILRSCHYSCFILK